MNGGRSRTFYDRRQRNLRLLGFPTYQRYLASDLWKGIRHRVLWRDRFTCRRCKSRATQVHHRSYSRETLDGTNLGALVSLCAGCHLSCKRRRTRAR